MVTATTTSTELIPTLPVELANRHSPPRHSITPAMLAKQIRENSGLTICRYDLGEPRQSVERRIQNLADLNEATANELAAIANKFDRFIDGIVEHKLRARVRSRAGEAEHERMRRAFKDIFAFRPCVAPFRGMQIEHLAQNTPEQTLLNARNHWLPEQERLCLEVAASLARAERASVLGFVQFKTTKDGSSQLARIVDRSFQIKERRDKRRDGHYTLKKFVRFHEHHLSSARRTPLSDYQPDEDCPELVRIVLDAAPAALGLEIVDGHELFSRTERYCVDTQEIKSGERAKSDPDPALVIAGTNLVLISWTE